MTRHEDPVIDFAQLLTYTTMNPNLQTKIYMFHQSTSSNETRTISYVTLADTVNHRTELRLQVLVMKKKKIWAHMFSTWVFNNRNKTTKNLHYKGRLTSSSINPCKDPARERTRTNYEKKHSIIKFACMNLIQSTYNPITIQFKFSCTHGIACQDPEDMNIVKHQLFVYCIQVCQ